VAKATLQHPCCIALGYFHAKLCGLQVQQQRLQTATAQDCVFS
jgi:hypothetical protein